MWLTACQWDNWCGTHHNRCVEILSIFVIGISQPCLILTNTEEYSNLLWIYFSLNTLYGSADGAIYNLCHGKGRGMMVLSDHSCIHSTITSKVSWGIVQCTVDFLSINFSGCLSCKISFILILITVKDGCYNHIVYTFDVTLILPIQQWYIATISFQVCVKLIDKRFSNISLFFQSTILMNYHMFAWTLFILQYCQDEADDSEWQSLGFVW